MGYGWSGGLRSSQAAQLPRLPRHSHLLRGRLTRLFGQRTREGTSSGAPYTQLADIVVILLPMIFLTGYQLQWISEVMHFCAGLPIILVGCKKDLRRDPRVIEELRKTNQRPVTPEEVRYT